MKSNNTEHMEKITESRTAHIIKRGDYIIKRYKDTKNLERDYKNIKLLSNIFKKPKTVEGYLYKVVKPIKTTNRSIIMEFAEGIPLSHAGFENDNLKHAAIMLALYHNQTIKLNGKVVRFLDYGLNDILYSSKNKTVTALDPGASFGKIGYFYEDLIELLVYTTNFTFRKLKGSKSYINLILNYYYKYIDSNSISTISKKDVKSQLSKFHRKYKRKNKLPFIRFLYLFWVERKIIQALYHIPYN